jgi:hypothetical protein
MSGKNNCGSHIDKRELNSPDLGTIGIALPPVVLQQQPCQITKWLVGRGQVLATHYTWAVPLYLRQVSRSLHQ